MTSRISIPFSVLDLCPVVEGSTPSETFRNTVDLAQHAERWGYRRYWLAEHHNMPGIASAATSVVIGHVAGATSTIRVGSGGVMLPNHSPLVIAEQFGTLESLYPGRIDLGLGRAPGTDQITARAMRRDVMAAGNNFPQDVMELRRYLGDEERGQAVRAVPGRGLKVPLWILGSSTFGSQLAAQFGLPYAFASHFAPDQMDAAIDLYRRHFQPSDQQPAPHLMLVLNVFAADTDEAAQRLFTSLQQQFLKLRTGTPGLLPAPVSTMDGRWSPMEQAGIDQALRCAVVGSPETVERGIRRFIERYRPDELMLTAMIHDHSARLRSFEIATQVRERLAAL
ncbi:MAG: luciferase [Hydrocarboniphaga sp.]|uniref:LLM class flavin-dependent oxidoreductase n=1 Tax=Hydrocarboniphaga sp. TaxID=2033016 RepID=UPI00262BFFE3|nr:LLM class flavin-dependent oxidoreductase [Hydrocarboniphaga sp.]MDB5968794.1 luciferase [Hydrocarboniphaga sp.]